MPVGLRSRVPAKITSSMRDPRSVLADCSPSTHEIASEMFDLPHPLGPMIAATPSPWNFSSVRSQNDLNPRIWSFFSLSNVLLLLQPAKGAEAHILDGLKHLLFPVTTQMPPAVRSKKNRPGWWAGHKLELL